MYSMFYSFFNPRSYAKKVQVPLKFRHSSVESGQDINRYDVYFSSLYLCTLNETKCNLGKVWSVVLQGKHALWILAWGFLHVGRMQAV